ncbi:MAG TPA: hypothetical protein VJR06_03085 [Nitrososphaerales archaeon]|nr:hypothetical protein [Nitrososphaerales archaeon]
MDPDDLAYKKSVRNMSLVLAAIAITIFAAIAVSPFVFPAANTFQPSVTYDSAFGFTLHLQVNSTSVSREGGVLVSGWLNSSSGSIVNVTAADSWGIGPAGLWTRVCTGGWPLGVGIMEGHYTQDNYTLGTIVQVPMPAVDCPVMVGTPGYFLLSPHTSKALVDLNGTPAYWVLQSSFSFSASQLPAGTYTAVLADEWGDVLTSNFIVS